MNNWAVWIVPIIAIVVWIVGSLLKGQENEKPGAQRPPRPEEGDAPRQQQSPDLEKFLLEVQRRKQAAERARQPQSEPRRERPPERRPVVPRAEPVARPRPSAPPVAQQQPPPKRPRPSELPQPNRPGDKVRPVPTAKPLEVIPVVEIVTVESVHPSARGASIAALGPEARDKAARTPLQGELAVLLKSPQTMRLAFVLREILDPPLSKRRHG